jgi:hypothetical protein
MFDWWDLFGRSSILAGFFVGALVALLPAWQRLHALKKGRPSQEQVWLLWLLDTLHMGSFFALMFALNEMAKREIVPNGLRWFLLSMAILSLCAAIALGHFAKDRTETGAKAADPGAKPSTKPE